MTDLLAARRTWLIDHLIEGHYPDSTSDDFLSYSFADLKCAHDLEHQLSEDAIQAATESQNGRTDSLGDVPLEP